MKNKEEAKEYLSTFITLKKVPVVAKATGINRQTIWQLSKGRSGAHQDTLDAIEKAFDDFDKNRAAGVAGLVEYVNSSSQEKDWKQIAIDAIKERDAYKEKLVKAESKVEELQGQVSEYAIGTLRLMKEGFWEASSHTTAYEPVDMPRIVVSGFTQKEALVKGPLNLLSQLSLVQTPAGTWVYKQP